MSNSPLTNVTIKIAGLGTLVVYGAGGRADEPVLTCHGGKLVGTDPPQVQGVYDIQGVITEEKKPLTVSYANVTCIAADADSWTFEGPDGGSQE